MKYIDEKIINYLDGQMNADQKKEFETELVSSHELMQKFTEYKKVYNYISLSKQKNLHQSYSESIIPEFRKRIESKASGAFVKRFAYVLASIIIITSALYLINILIVQNQNPETLLTTIEIESNDLDVLFDNMSADDIILAYNDTNPGVLESLLITHYSESVLDSSLAEENYFALNDIDYYQIENLLSDEELDLVYNEIINKILF